MLNFFQKKIIKPKVFCIGFWKTGTTSIGKVFVDLGYRLGDQEEAEMLVFDWGKRDFSSLIEYCKKYDAFQDTPFACDYTFQAIDAAFPGSKFILTMRDENEWFASLVNHHTKFASDKSGPPTKEDLQNAMYRYKGFMWDTHILQWGENVLYDKDIYVNRYRMHNEIIINYFKSRPTDLLVLDLQEADSCKKLYDFLEKPYNGEALPWLNRLR